ncbi:TMEM175 family protein [Limnovirga soli]|uniref:DUF1211 domain-containing protein n=1 Tax=Limnovirga soli TaxID=2656915 RepID=A0A8J8JX09_9BACT|nr:TMEM175 family protein [Limnovirga soli]NNV55866.1 DUF1211 domain-containing protein [Limnovirga soli]
MGKGRLEAFSDGVIAIIITIMVLELKIPHGDTLEAIQPLFPVLISYILSFVNIGIYWNNHHHLFHAVHRVSGKILWANLHLLFWLSLMPFVTAWMGENHFTTLPVALMGVDLFMCGVAYFILTKKIIHLHGKSSKVAELIGIDKKGAYSVLAYFTAIFTAYIHPYISLAIYALVAAIWFIPDRRIENKIGEIE